METRSLPDPSPGISAPLRAATILPRYKAALAALLLIAFLLLMELGSARPPVRAEQGTVDLTGASLRDSAVSLSGAWAFYWGRLLSPRELSEDSAPLPQGFIALPATWTRVRLEGKPIPRRGNATFTLRVRHAWKGQEVGVRIRKVNFAYRLFADSRLIAESGTLPVAGKAFVGRYDPQIAFFVPESDETVLTLQVSNEVAGAWGGPVDEIDMGPRSAIESESGALLIADAFNIGGRVLLLVLFLIAFALLGSRTALVFSSFALASIVRLSEAGEILLLRLFPRMSLDLFIRSFLLSSLLTGPLMLLSILTFFREDRAAAGEPPTGGRGAARDRMNAEVLPLVVGAVSILELLFFAFAGLSVCLGWFEYLVPVLILSLLYAGAAIVDRLNRLGSNRGLLGAYLLFLFQAAVEALNQLRITNRDFLYPFSFLRAGPVDLSSFRIQQGLVSYLIFACLGFYFLYRITARRLSRSQVSPRPSPAPPSLDEFARAHGISDREKDILSLAIMGLSYEEIGERCFISKNTVKAHLGSIYRKLGVKNKTELASKFGGAR